MEAVSGRPRSSFGLSHGPLLGTIIRIVYFLIVFSLFCATLLYFRHRSSTARRPHGKANSSG
ncbi:MAG: DUF2227 family putative metal-binding protein [Chloracidobacterium sp.]|nr:DUF2227 family putative metal-binding protein [Chloracidobacterium sp.]